MLFIFFTIPASVSMVHLVSLSSQSIFSVISMAVLAFSVVYY